MHLSGKTINLISEDYTATIVTMGGAIASLKFHGKDITTPFQPNTIPFGHIGKILAPWPNRIVDGKYKFEGKEYHLPISEADTNCALHGLVAWQDWTIVDMNGDSLFLETYISPNYGYPFLVKVIAHYEVIGGMGLKVDLKAINVGENSAPFGVGMHPYLTCDNTPIDMCTLGIPYQEVFSQNERKCPIEKVAVADLDLDFSTPKLLGEKSIDSCFIAQDTKRVSTVTLETKKLQVYLKSNAPFVQIYTPDTHGRVGLAVEPMSCAPDAFNSGNGLITLKEQQIYNLNFLIGAIEK